MVTPAVGLARTLQTGVQLGILLRRGLEDGPQDVAAGIGGGYHGISHEASLVRSLVRGWRLVVVHRAGSGCHGKAPWAGEKCPKITLRL